MQGVNWEVSASRVDGSAFASVSYGETLVTVSFAPFMTLTCIIAQDL